MALIDVIVPDLGNFKDVPVVDVLVAVGAQVEVDTPLVTLETDKASIDVPSSAAGRVVELLVKPGSKVSKGSLLLRLEAAAGASAPVTEAAAATPPASAAVAGAPPAAVAATAAPSRSWNPTSRPS